MPPWVSGQYHDEKSPFDRKRDQGLHDRPDSVSHWIAGGSPLCPFGTCWKEAAPLILIERFNETTFGKKELVID
jgi:hypothetical protein